MDWSSLKAAWEIGRKTFIVWSVITLLVAFITALFLSVLQKIVDSIEINVETGLGVRSILMLLLALVFVMFVQSLFNRIPGIMWKELTTKYGIEWYIN